MLVNSCNNANKCNLIVKCFIFYLVTYHNHEPRFFSVVLWFVSEQKALSGTLVFRKWFTSCYMQINQKTSCRQIPHTVAAFPHTHCPTELTPWATICLTTNFSEAEKVHMTSSGLFPPRKLLLVIYGQEKTNVPEKKIVQCLWCYVKLHCISGHCELFLTVSLSLSLCLLASSQTCERHWKTPQTLSLSVFKWPPFSCFFLDRIIPLVRGPDICQLKGCRGFCLSVAVTAAHAYLPCYFEQWLTAGQAWHSQACGGACYYANINIPINTWSTIEKIITRHHSAVSER